MLLGSFRLLRYFNTEDYSVAEQSGVEGRTNSTGCGCPVRQPLFSVHSMNLNITLYILQHIYEACDLL